MFGAVAKGDTDITPLIRRNPQIVGRTADAEVTAFTDGGSGLRSILADTGSPSPRFSIGFILPCGFGIQRKLPAYRRRTIPTGCRRRR